MSTESKNKWRRLHELCLRVKEAKDFETLGAVVEELSELKTAEGDAAKFGNSQCFSAISNAYIAAWKKLGQWQENPPPIAPQETQIGPGNPFPIPPPPPPPTVAGENTNAMLQEYISIDELKERVQDVLRPFAVSIRDARMINGDFARQSMNLISERIEGVFSNVDAKPPTVAPGEWTGELVFNLISPKGLTNPWNYNSASHDERAECERIARAINRNTPLLEPRAETTVISGEAFYKALQKADGGSFGVGAPSCAWEMLGHKSQDLYERAAKIAADTVRSKTAPGPAGHADKPAPQAPGSLDELRKTIVCAITNEKEAVNGQYGGADVGLLSNAIVRKVDKAFADYAAQNAKAIERAAEPVKTPEPWTGDELYEAFRQAVWGAGKKEDWQRFSDSVRDDFLILTMLVNQRMGIAAK